MPELKITANTNPVKKSLLDLNKSVKDLGKTKVSIFSEADRKFIKNELNRELKDMNTQLKSNKAEITSMIGEQKKLVEGSDLELQARKKIIDAYGKQSQLAKQIGTLEKQRKSAGLLGGMGGRGGMMGMLGTGLGLAASAVGAGALAGVAYGGMRTMQAGEQYRGGVDDRVRLHGLGVFENERNSESELAKAGLTEQGLNSRRIGAVATLGREGGSRSSVLEQAQFERANGLEGGTMTNVAGSLRGQMGGKGADVAQQKMQASILASGIEDALGPYLDSMTDLLTNINENGLSSTEEITKVFAQIAKDGQRTPEQLASSFKGLDSAIRGAKGEANAFGQTAFARAGIGGNTIGGVQSAMEGGGLFGLDSKSLSKEGYNPELIKNMGAQGLTEQGGGLQKRAGAYLDMFRQTGQFDKTSDITDVNQKNRVTSMANSVFGTKGESGFQTLQLLEKAKNAQVDEGAFKQQMEAIQAGKDPQVQRLDKINETLAGQTNILTNINSNLMETLGKSGGAQIKNAITEADNQGVKATTNTVGAINDTGAIDAGRKAVKSTGDYLLEGHIADAIGSLGDSISNMVEKNGQRALDESKNYYMPKNNINIKIQSSDGKVSNKVHH